MSWGTELWVSTRSHPLFHLRLSSISVSLALALADATAAYVRPCRSSPAPRRGRSASTLRDSSRGRSENGVCRFPRARGSRRPSVAGVERLSFLLPPPPPLPVFTRRAVGLGREARIRATAVGIRNPVCGLRPGIRPSRVTFSSRYAAASRAPFHADGRPGPFILSRKFPPAPSSTRKQRRCSLPRARSLACFSSPSADFVELRVTRRPSTHDRRPSDVLSLPLFLSSPRGKLLVDDLRLRFPREIFRRETPRRSPLRFARKRIPGFPVASFDTSPRHVYRLGTRLPR